MDCTSDNKLTFNHCMKEENRYVDARFCDYMEYIYKNNTLYEWEVNQNGLFCIIKSNLPAQYTVQQKTVADITTICFHNKYHILFCRKSKMWKMQCYNLQINISGPITKTMSWQEKRGLIFLKNLYKENRFFL